MKTENRTWTPHILLLLWSLLLHSFTWTFAVKGRIYSISSSVTKDVCCSQTTRWLTDEHYPSHFHDNNYKLRSEGVFGDCPSGTPGGEGSGAGRPYIQLELMSVNTNPPCLGTLPVYQDLDEVWKEPAQSCMNHVQSTAPKRQTAPSRCSIQPNNKEARGGIFIALQTHK